MDKKEEMRKHMLLRRREEPFDRKKSRDRKILDILKKRIALMLEKIVCVYASTAEEVDTTTLIDFLFKEKKIVVVPKISKERCLVLFRIESIDDLSVGAFGVLEPKQQCKEVFTTSVDLFIVPGIAFDRQGNRLGWGKGYYDRLLQGVTVPRIALAYSFQVVDYIPHDDHDIRMTSIRTEKEIIDIHETSLLL
ncbi:5-formyltetrahydrofolate cyclo-ligase [Candidatus Gottesmanbacteria bacterium]|nr:5-formyltetrahydrofolate cyclo-ligase [Candidatus Gottesmanbacteria bacterium]